MGGGPGRSALRFSSTSATTAHVPVVYPWVLESSSLAAGVMVGVNLLASGAFSWDPFEAYSAGITSNPNVFVMGAPGNGKSALIKTLLYRMVGVYGADRNVAIIDPKGEYSTLAEWCGWQQIRLTPGGQVRVNPLAGERGGLDDLDAVDRRSKLVAGLISAVLCRPLSGIEEAGLWASVGAVCRTESPTLVDLANVLTSPPVDVLAVAEISEAEWATAMDHTRRALTKLLTRSLRGMFDGPSTVTVGNSRGLVLDLSAVQTDTEALPLVMTAAISWLNELRATGAAGTRWIQVFDEAWSLLAYRSITEYLQQSFKLGRSWGVSNWLVTHRLTDMRAQADDHQAAAKIADGLVSDCATKIVMAQDAGQVAETAARLALSAREADVIGRIPPHRALWQLGPNRAVVDHIVGAREWALVDTDANMRGTVNA